MGALKDIVDLCTQLRNENRDGRIAAAISEIQSLTLSLQSEQAAIVEKNSELVTENLGLKRKLLDLETSHAQAVAAMQEKHHGEIARITASNARPKRDALGEKTAEILLCFFKKAKEVPDKEIARHFQMELSMAEYHLDVLVKKKYIFYLGLVSRSSIFDGDLTEDNEDGSPAHKITAEGREYCIENELVT